MVIRIESKEGEALSMIDFGEMFLKEDMTATRTAFLCNLTDESVRVHVQVSMEDEYQLSVKLIDLGDTEISELHFLQMISEMPQEDILVPSQGKVQVLFLVTSNMGASTTAPRKVRTSYFQVNPSLKLFSTSKGGIFSEIVLPIHISLCVSLLSVDENDIEFDSCQVGNNYVRDIQVWNRSEGVLKYRVVPFGHTVIPSSLQMIDVESGKKLIGRESPLSIEAFSSQRIRISLHAACVQDITYRFCLENCNNPSNRVILTCRITVTDNDEQDEFTVENDSGQQIGKNGRVFDFGDCYNGLETTRKLWLKNNTTKTIEISISTDCPDEIVVNTVEKTSVMSKEWSGSASMISGPKDPRAIGNALSSLQRDEDFENSDGNSIQQKIRGQVDPTGRGQLVNEYKEMQFGSSIQPADTEESLNRNQTVGFKYMNRKVKAPEKFVSNDLQMSSGYLMMDSNSGDFDDEGFCPGSELRLQRFFTMNVLNNAYEQDHRNIANPMFADHGKSDVVSRINQTRMPILKRHPGVTETSRESEGGKRSREADVVVLAGGARKPFHLVFTPKSKRSGETSQMMAGSLVEKALVVVGRDGKDRSGGRDSKKAPPYPHKNEGVLERRSMKLSFVYKRSLRNPNSEQHTEYSKPKPRISSKQISCRARTCTSIITCSPKVADLGECNIGDFRNVSFTIKNESDLPALVLPYMVSQSLALVEKELHIPPRQSKQCKFEYIARQLENDYRKNILLINAFNSHCNLGVQVRAKISDAQQVLRHSLFYKLYTRHNKKQIQVYFNKCFYNMPNLRTFVFRNVHNKAIRVELTVDDATDLGIYLHRPTELSEAGHMLGGKEPNANNDNSNSTIAHQQTLKIEELKWGSIEMKASDRKRTKSFSSGLNLGVNDIHFAVDESIDNGYSSDGELSKALSKRSSSTRNSNIDEQSEKKALSATSNYESDSSSFVRIMDTIDYPFSIIQENMASARRDGLDSSEIDMEVLATESLKESISAINKCFLQLKEDMISHRSLLPLSTQLVHRSVVVPPGKSYEFAVLFSPKHVAKNDVQVEESSPLQVVRKIKLQLLNANPTGHDSVGSLHDMALSAPLSSYQPLMYDGVPLKPRLLLMKAKLVQTKMRVIQKNINFGNTKVGELSTSSTTVSNLSKVPLVYSISKSGSISSSFLSVSNGRKGMIDPMSSKSIEFAFKPTLHGPFEETLTIENVLDNSNCEAVKIKAKVFKQELFAIQPVGDGKDSTQYVEDPSLGLASETMAEVHQEFNELSKYVMEAPPPVFLGVIRPREPSRISLNFKVCNISNKNRKFVIDCKNNLHVKRGNKVVDEAFSMYIQCRIAEREKLQIGCSNGDRNMTEEEKQQMRDKLEKFNQKLKIAIRKEKKDKIEKYEKKIRETEAKLAKGKFRLEDNEDDNEAGEPSANKEKKSETDLTKRLNEEIVSAESIAFSLLAEEAATVIVNIIIYPIALDEIMEGDVQYSVRGALRIFESKNEDFIRHVLFGAVMDRQQLAEAIGGPDLKGDRPVYRLEQTDSGNLPSSAPIALGFPREMPLSLPFRIDIRSWCIESSKKLYPRHQTPSCAIYKDSLFLIDNATTKQRSGEFSIIPPSNTSLQTMLSLNFDVNASCLCLQSLNAMTPFSPEQHGDIVVSITNPSEGKDVIKSEHILNTSSLPYIFNLEEEVLCRVKWSPIVNMSPSASLVACLAVSMKDASFQSNVTEGTTGGVKGPDVDSEKSTSSNEFPKASRSTRLPNGSTLHIPIVCSMMESTIKAKGWLSFGEVVHGTTFAASLLVTNRSSWSPLRYRASFSNANEVGSISFLQDCSEGFLQPSGSCFLQLEFRPLKLGKFEDEIVICNVDNENDFIRVALSALVSLPKSQFVEFPDLGVDEFGKDRKLDFGQIQIPQSSDHELNDLKFKYPFRIKNLFGKVLYVSAVSNLKRQCFVYTSADCSTHVSDHPLLPNELSTIYIVIRPSVFSQQTRASKAGASDLFSSPNISSRDEKSSQSGRELLGGIRFIFTSAPTHKGKNAPEKSAITQTTSADDLSAVSSTSFAPPVELTSTKDINETSRKIFETSVSFKVLIGTSLPRVVSKSMRCRFIQILKDSPNYTLSGVVKGCFEVENMSKLFPHNFTLTANDSSLEVLPDDENIDQHYRSLPRGSITFHILGDKVSGRINPLAKERIYFVVCFRGVYGLITKTIEMKNFVTQQNDTMSISLFLDPCRLFSSLPLDKSGQIVSKSAVERFLPTKSHSTTGVMSSRGVFPTQIDSVFSIAPIWVTPIATESKYDGSAKAMDSVIDANSSGACFLPDFPVTASMESVAVTESCGDVICTWRLTNPHSSLIRISPASDLPVVVQINVVDGASDDMLKGEAPSSFLESHASSMKALGNYLKHGNKKHRSNQDMSSHDSTRVSDGFYTDKNKKLRSMVSVPPELAEQGFSLCGEAVTVLPWQEVSVVVRASPGHSISHHLRKRPKKYAPLLSGCAFKVMGTVAFISSEHTLKSFFDPVKSLTSASHAAVDASSWPSQAATSTVYPIVGFTSVVSSFVVPLIKIFRNRLNFGTLQSYRTHFFDIEIENLCERDILVRLENLHSWMRVLGEAAGSGRRLDGEKNSSQLVLRAKAIHAIKMSVTVPFRVTESKFTHTLRVRNLSLSPTNTPFRRLRTSLPIQVTFDINQNSGLSIKNEENGPLAFSVQLQSQYVFVDNVSIPHRSDGAQSSQKKLIFVKNTSQECMHVLFGTEDTECLKGVTKLKISRKEGSVLKEDVTLSPIQRSKSESSSKYAKQFDVSALPFDNLQSPNIELMPGEVAEFVITVVSTASARLGKEMLDDLNTAASFAEEDRQYFEQHVSDAGSDDDSVCSDDKGSIGSNEDDFIKDKKVIGPLTVGKVFFKFAVASMLRNDDVSFSSLLDSQTRHSYFEKIDIGVVSKLVPSPTICIEDDDGRRLNSFCFMAVRHPSDFCEGKLNAGTTVSIENKELSFRLPNATEKNLPFRFSCFLETNQNDFFPGTIDENDAVDTASTRGYEVGYQRKDVGNRLLPIAMQKSMNDNDLLPSIQPNQGILSPGMKMECTLAFTASAIGLEAAQEISSKNELLKTLYAHVFVYDESYPFHPPLVIPVYVQLSDVQSSCDGVSVTDMGDVVASRRKSSALSNMQSSSNFYESMEDSEIPNKAALRNGDTTSSPPSLRLRGVTPCQSSGCRYEINLGQEVQQQEESKWIISLQNLSRYSRLRYVISLLSPETDSKWLSFSHADGVIAPESTSSLVLHFVRANVGLFMTYLMIENHSNPHDIVLIRISLQVVQDWQLVDPERRGYHRLFRIETPLRWRDMDAYLDQRLKKWNIFQRGSLSSQTLNSASTTSDWIAKGDGKNILDFGKVCVGKLYTRRYFLLCNVSDISLEFQLSSSFPPQELNFSLTPVLPSPLSVVTVGPGERLCIYIVYTPQLERFGDNASAASARGRHASPSSWPVEGKIFVSCKLVKNHQETINIRATVTLPSIGVFLKENMLNLPSHSSQSVFMQLGVPEYTDIGFGEHGGMLRINTNHSNSALKDGRWTTASIISVRNITHHKDQPGKAPEDIIVTVYTGMSCNGFEIRLLELESNGQVDKAMTAERNKCWKQGGGEDGGSTLDISLSHGEECFLHIVYDPDKITSSKRSHSNSCVESNASAANSFTIIAEDHFMLYNRYKISEKTRIPVRVLLAVEPAAWKVPNRGESPDAKGLVDCNRQLSQYPSLTNVSPTTEIPLSFSGLEGAISSYLRTFSQYWSKVFALYASPRIPNPPLSTHKLDGYRLLPTAAADEQHMSPVLSDDSENILISESGAQQTIENFFDGLKRYITVTDMAIYERKDEGSPEDNEAKELMSLAHEIAELLVHFVAITDMLVLHTMRQSDHGHEWMTSAHTAVPVSKLSMLIFSMVFKHPIFAFYYQNNGENQKSDSTLFPPPLIPFVRTLLYYMSFFPDPPVEMRPINELCQVLRYCLQIRVA